METNEVMMNEDVMETATEEIANASSGCGLKTAAGFGLGILAGVTLCKVVKPLMVKLKARKEKKREAKKDEAVIDAEIVEESDVAEE